MLNVLINFHTNCIEQIKNLRSLTFGKNNIEKNVKERVLFKNYKESFERLLHLWFSEQCLETLSTRQGSHMRSLTQRLPW